MKLISLTQGQFSKVDDSDFIWLSVWKWRAFKVRGIYYAVRSVRIEGENRTIFMHRQIMNTPVGKETDHKDRDGLNNQRNNLRDCTHRQNNMNRKSFGSSKYVGVSYSKIQNKYIARIRINGEQVFLGSFKNEIKAAHAYDEAAKIHHGEFANLNFKLI